MVNNLSSLAEFLEDDSLPSWLKKALREQRERIAETLEKGERYSLTGPEGESVMLTPTPKSVAEVA